MDDIFAFVLLFENLNGMEYMGGYYFIKFFKVEEGLSELVRFVSSHICKETVGLAFTVFVHVPLMRGKGKEYMIEVDDDEVTFEYVLKFVRRGEVGCNTPIRLEGRTES